MKTPHIVKLNLPKLIRVAANFVPSGKVEMTASKLVYLNIDDGYIHQLFPLLKNKKIKKPDYFAAGGIGAHISLIYPEEQGEILQNLELSTQHYFKITDVVSADIGIKRYYVLLVVSPSLLQLRQRYSLSDLLCFKDYAIGFHITIGIEAI